MAMTQGFIESATYMAIAPGKTIKEQLEDRGLSQKEFAIRMGLSEKHISQLINGHVALTPDVAHRLEGVLGIPTKFWLNLEAMYQEEKSKALEEIEQQEELKFARNFPISAMKKLGWLPKNLQRSWDYVLALRSFFEVGRLDSLERLSIPGIAYRQLNAEGKRDYSLAVWAQKAKLEARIVQCSEINLDRLTRMLPDIRNMTNKDIKIFLPELTEKLATCGIAFVILPHISSSFLHGASFVDGKKIIVGVTYRGKMADVFWFSLFHELGHVLNGDLFDPLAGDKESQEQNADIFAQKSLILEEEYSEFISKSRFTKANIIDFADSIHVAPFIVLGRLQKENRVPYDRFIGLKKQYNFEATFKSC